MRNFDDNEKKIMAILSKSSNSDTRCLSKILEEEYFDTFALIGTSQNNCYLLMLPQKNVTVIRIVYGLFGILDFLEKNGFIFFMNLDAQPNSFEIMWKNAKNPIKKNDRIILNTDDDYFDLNDNTIKKKNGNIIFTSIKLPQKLYTHYNSLLNSPLYISAELRKFVENKYKTDDDVKLIQSVRVARIAAIVGAISAIAAIVGAISAIVGIVGI